MSELITYEVFTDKPTFSSLSSAVTELQSLVRQGEHAKIAAARVIDAIDRQQLWREAGASSFKEFFPELLIRTAQIGWGSPTQLKRALQVVRVFLSPVAPFTTGEIAARVLSHLYEFVKVAPYDAREETLVDGDPPKGKLPLEQFEKAFDLVEVLTRLKPNIVKGELETEAGARELMTPQLAEFYYNVFGVAPSFQKSQTWKISDTQRLISALRGDEDEDDNQKATRHWVVVENSKGDWLLKTLQFLVGGEIVAEVTVNQWHTAEEAKALIGSDKKTIES